MTRLLLISPNFPPLGDAQAYQSWRMAKAFCHYGFQVTVVAALPEGVRGENLHRLSLTRCAHANLRTVAFPAGFCGISPGALLGKAYRALLPYDPRMCLRGLRRTVKRLLKRESYDVIVSVAEPLVSHAALRCMQKFVGAAKQIAWFSDPVPSLSDVQWMRMKWRRRRCCEVAAGCLSFCEAVITVTEEIADRIRSLAGRQAPRITVVPHCFDEDDWPWPPAKQRREGEVTVVHSGALCYHRSPARLLTGVQHFQKQNGGRPAVRVQFQGAVAKNLQSEVDAWRSSGLASFEGPVDYSVSKESIRQADLLCVIDAELPKNIHLPSKIADYVGACRPILYLGRPDSPTCRCLSRIHPCFAQGHTVEETATALKELIDRRTTIPASAYWKAYKGFTARAVHRWIREFV